MNISFVIIHYGNIEKLIKLIDSIKIQFLEPEIIIVNNGPWKINLSSIDNICGGYPLGVNIGVKNSKRKWVMLLSPAVELFENFKINLEKYFKRYNDVNIFAPKIVDKYFNIKPSLRRNYSIKKHLTGKWKIPTALHPKKDEFVEQPMSAAIIVKRSILTEYKFDERFKLYFSDVDWCRTMNNINEKILYCNDLRVYHEFGGTTKTLGIKRKIILYKDYLKFIKKIFYKN